MRLRPDGSASDVVFMAVAEQIRRLRERLVQAEAQRAAQINAVDESNLAGAANLAHYWAIRPSDLRDLQLQLASFGLSSLGRCEPHVRATLEAIAATLQALSGHPGERRAAAPGFDDGPRLLRRHAVELLGPEPVDRQTRIMVTLPTEAATNGALVQSLIEQGMNLARVNCAHDDARAWAAMIANVKRASAATGLGCRVAMDLPGPKVRTGQLEDGPRVIKLRPGRDVLGRITAPAWCWLGASENPIPPPEPGMPLLPLPAAWLAGLSVGERIEFADTRGSRRHLTVESTHRGAVLVSARQTAYIAAATVLRSRAGDRATVADLPPTEQFLTLHRGDSLMLTRDCTPAPVIEGGLARIGCTLPEAFGQVQIGHAVHLDDGKMIGEVINTDDQQFTVRITHAAIKGSRLRAAKGINLPDTVLPVPALTAADRAHLPFIAAHADLVELSFVRTPQDVQDLISALADIGDRRLGIVVKIETAQGFRNLPAILFAALRRPHAGVMIARGDLAGECGYERLAELQEETMWLAEAAYLPVIWATQVLDQLARTGQPSRAEITDAAMSVRAECVMLNKGPYIHDAVASLDDILQRMTGHRTRRMRCCGHCIPGSWRRPLRRSTRHHGTPSTNHRENRPGSDQRSWLSERKGRASDPG
jgi:pyruvate kinase